MKVLKKVNAKVKFLNRQNKYLTARLNRLLCNALIQIHFVAHRGFTSWCLLLSKNLKNRLRLCAVHFRKINLLPVSERVKSCIATIVFKYWNEIVSSYINDMFELSYNKYPTRSQMALDILLQRTITGQEVLFFLGPKIWTKITHITKNVKTTASFTHALKREILNKLCR